MSSDQPFNKVIVLDLDEYAGNFEREMCAFITGRYGDCEVGKEIAEAIFPALTHAEWYNEHVVPEPDEHGSWRPASIWPSVEPSDQSHTYDAVAIFVDAFPPAEVLAEMIERARDYCTMDPKPGPLSQWQSGPHALRGVRFLEPSYQISEVAPYPLDLLASLLSAAG